MFNCSVCLLGKNINEFKINKNCGHICICSDCLTTMTSHMENVNADGTSNCPICRNNGEYMNIYITEVARPEGLFTLEDIVITEEVVITETVNTKEEYESNRNLTKLMEYTTTSNYTLITLEDSIYLYFKDYNISKSNFIEAYYGTEYSYIDGNPKIVDVTKRIAMALAFNKSHLIIEKNNLIHNIDLEQGISEKFSLFVVIQN